MRPLYCYYGDDFTGSTDVLDCLASGGVRSVLFTRVPSPEMLARFADYQAMGIAGDSRSRTPAEMEAFLPGVFELLKSLGARVAHYKVCSTFDSSPERGSIGRAMEIGRMVFGGPVPIVVGAPHLGRYVVFGNLFARAGDAVYRIDRHPTMRCHPVTPMTEADLRLHLSMQTPLRIALMDLPTLQAANGGAALDALVRDGAEAVLFDGADEASLRETGRVIWERAWEHAPERQLFAIGSSGLTCSLIPQWRAASLLDDSTACNKSAAAEKLAGERLAAVEKSAAPEKPAAVDAVLALSGSCSPVTAGQIEWALANGYAEVKIDAARLLDAAAGGPAQLEYARAAVEALRRGRSVVAYTALGPLKSGAAAHGDDLGVAMGQLLREIVLQSGVRRVVLAGGDTSSHAASVLGFDALTWMAMIEPGAPLCRAYCGNALLDGLEIVMKGGQVGHEDFFERVRRGGA